MSVMRIGYLRHGCIKGYTHTHIYAKSCIHILEKQKQKRNVCIVVSLFRHHEINTSYLLDSTITRNVQNCDI